MKQLSALFVFFLLSGLGVSACQYPKRNKSLLITKTTVAENPASEELPEEKIKPLVQNHPAELFQIEKKETKKQIDLEIIVSYFRYLNSLSSEKLKEEHRRTHQEFDHNKSPTNRLRLAILLGFSSAKHRDTKRSLALLKTYLDDPNEQNTILRDFSFLLYTFVQQIKTQEKETQKLSQQLKKERRENQTRKKMIEELKTIEKNLIKRDNTIEDE